MRLGVLRTWTFEDNPQLSSSSHSTMDPPAQEPPPQPPSYSLEPRAKSASFSGPVAGVTARMTSRLMMMDQKDDDDNNTTNDGEKDTADMVNSEFPIVTANPYQSHHHHQRLQHNGFHRRMHSSDDAFVLSSLPIWQLSNAHDDKKNNSKSVDDSTFVLTLTRSHPLRAEEAKSCDRNDEVSMHDDDDASDDCDDNNAEFEPPKMEATMASSSSSLSPTSSRRHRRVRSLFSPLSSAPLAPRGVLRFVTSARSHNNKKRISSDSSVSSTTSSTSHIIRKSGSRRRLQGAKKNKRQLHQAVLQQTRHGVSTIDNGNSNPSRRGVCRLILDSMNRSRSQKNKDKRQEDLDNPAEEEETEFTTEPHQDEAQSQAVVTELMLENLEKVKNTAELEDLYDQLDMVDSQLKELEQQLGYEDNVFYEDNVTWTPTGVMLSPDARNITATAVEQDSGKDETAVDSKKKMVIINAATNAKAEATNTPPSNNSSGKEPEEGSAKMVKEEMRQDGPKTNSVSAEDDALSAQPKRRKGGLFAALKRRSKRNPRGQNKSQDITKNQDEATETQSVGNDQTEAARSLPGDCLTTRADISCQSLASANDYDYSYPSDDTNNNLPRNQQVQDNSTGEKKEVPPPSSGKLEQKRAINEEPLPPRKKDEKTLAHEDGNCTCDIAIEQKIVKKELKETEMGADGNDSIVQAVRDVFPPATIDLEDMMVLVPSRRDIVDGTEFIVRSWKEGKEETRDFLMRLSPRTIEDDESNESQSMPRVMSSLDSLMDVLFATERADKSNKISADLDAETEIFVDRQFRSFDFAIGVPVDEERTRSPSTEGGNTLNSKVWLDEGDLISAVTFTSDKMHQDVKEDESIIISGLRRLQAAFSTKGRGDVQTEENSDIVLDSKRVVKVDPTEKGCVSAFTPMSANNADSKPVAVSSKLLSQPEQLSRSRTATAVPQEPKAGANRRSSSVPTLPLLDSDVAQVQDFEELRKRLSLALTEHVKEETIAKETQLRKRPSGIDAKGIGQDWDPCCVLRACGMEIHFFH